MISLHFVSLFVAIATNVQLCHSYGITTKEQSKLGGKSVSDFPHERRSFLSSGASVLVAPFLVGNGPWQNEAWAASPSPMNVQQTVKVSPISHTFIVSSSDDKVKPLRENDATRYFTNARVVYFFYSGSADSAVATTRDILQLTSSRKEAQGPGVTPGKLYLAKLTTGGSANEDSVANEILASFQSNDSTLSTIEGFSIKDILQGPLSNTPGDVLLMPPQKSRGTTGNAKIIEDSSRQLGLSVGGAKGGGIISVLINGPQAPQPLAVKESGYSTSSILWYSV